MDQIAHFQLQSVLEEHPLWTLCRALDTSLNREVGLKILTPELSNNQDYLQSLFTEIRKVSSINHPHIAQVYLCGKEGETYYVVSELAKGNTLEGLIHEKVRIGEAMVIAILSQTIEGLEMASEAGVIHGQICPFNLLIDTMAGIKVLNFGFSQITKYLPNLEYSVEYIPYASPEFASGTPEDIRSDIYTLGVCAYQALSGRLPFWSKNRQEMLQKRIQSKPPDLTSIVPDLHSETASILNRMMEPNLQKRFQNYSELKEALTQAQLKIITESKPAQPVQAIKSAPKKVKSALPPVSDAGISSPRIKSQKVRKRRKTASYVTAILCLLIAVLAMASVYKRNGQSRSAVPDAKEIDRTAYPPVEFVKVAFAPHPVEELSKVGFLQDHGEIYGSRAGGRHYGWTAANQQEARQRPPYVMRNEFFTMTRFADKKWEFGVPAGEYTIRTLMGDSFYPEEHCILIEGHLVAREKTTYNLPWVETYAVVKVDDGRITISSCLSSETKLNSVEIWGGNQMTRLGKTIGTSYVHPWTEHFVGMVDFGSSKELEGILPDYGYPFATLQNGFAYGWNKHNDSAKIRYQPVTEDMNSLNYLRKDGVDYVWEMELPNGSYIIQLITAGDPKGGTTQVYVEGEKVVDFNILGSKQYRLEKAFRANIQDGRLTISPPPGKAGAQPESQEIGITTLRIWRAWDHSFTGFERRF